MPAGVTWSKYLKFLGASLLSMFAGATVVHNYFKPSLVSIFIPVLLFLTFTDHF